MVNTKGVTFKVNKQTPIAQGPAQAYGTVINCRPPVGKWSGHEQQKELKSYYVPLSNIDGVLKRKRGEGKKLDVDHVACPPESMPTSATWLSTALVRPQLTHHWPQRKPTRLRTDKPLSKGVDLDCWFTILSFSDPAQLLEMRKKIVSCYRFLRDNPMLWKHSRNYYYGNDMPDPPSDLTEFEYAHLRHGHGCMRCGATHTRKTYWAFLRRWCRTCLQSKTLKEQDALALMRDANGDDISYIHKCLPSGIFDSWGNFVGVGPASTHSLKTVYSLPDVQKLVAEYIAVAQEKGSEPAEVCTWYAEWHASKIKVVEERQAFAKMMELWEETTRAAKTCDYQARKSARKAYFELQAAQLTPPITMRQMEACPAYRRAVVIPKAPNITSWNQLRPKLEKEVALIPAKGDAPENGPGTSSTVGMAGTTTTGFTTLNHSMSIPQSHMYPLLGLTLPPIHRHLF